MINISYRPLIVLGLIGTLAACGNKAEEQEELTLQAAEAELSSAANVDKADDSGAWKTTDIIAVAGDRGAKDEALSKILDADQIPYPLYPESSRYRIGGENGLKIVLFQTTDSFEDVDAYYQTQANMARLSAMNDYVRYSAGKNDNDPWATENPGIVIHRFNSESEREAVGADVEARTNIIMSFQ